MAQPQRVKALDGAPPGVVVGSEGVDALETPATTATEGAATIAAAGTGQRRGCAANQSSTMAGVLFARTTAHSPP